MINKQESDFKDKVLETLEVSKIFASSNSYVSSLQHKSLTSQYKAKLAKKEWKKANSQAVFILLYLISKSNQQAVENLEYAGNIWLYAIKKYIKADYFIHAAAFNTLIKWKKNKNYSVKKTTREIEYFANHIPQLESSQMNLEFVKFLFLKELPEEYKLAHQILESQNLSIKAIIMWLIKIKQRLKAARDKKFANRAQSPTFK